MGNLNCAKKRDYEPVPRPKPLPPPPSDALRHDLRSYYGSFIYPAITISLIIFAGVLVLIVLNATHKNGDPSYDLIDYLQNEAGNPMKTSALVLAVGVSSAIMILSLLCGMATICSQSKNGIVGFACQEGIGFLVVLTICLMLLTALSHYGADAGDKLDAQCSAQLVTTTSAAVAAAASSSELQARAAIPSSTKDEIAAEEAEEEAYASGVATTPAETTYFPPLGTNTPAATAYVPPVETTTPVATIVSTYFPSITTYAASFEDSMTTGSPSGDTTSEESFYSDRRKLQDSNFVGQVCTSTPDLDWCADQASTLSDLCDDSKPFYHVLTRTKGLGYVAMAGAVTSLLLSFVLCCFAYEVHTNKSALDVIVPEYLEDYDRKRGGGQAQWGKSAFSGGTVRQMSSTYETGHGQYSSAHHTGRTPVRTFGP